MTTESTQEECVQAPEAVASEPALVPIPSPARGPVPDPVPVPVAGPSVGRRALDAAVIAVPALGWLALAWKRRWIADDGMIVGRTVREILAGNGPVFNPGERVEADTSTLWTWLVAGLAWAGRANVYSVLVGTGLVLAPLGLVLALLGARRLHRRTAPGRLVVPLGAAVVLALSPFWDFATSGLEDSLTFCWLGGCWWLMAGMGPDTPRRNRVLAFVAGLGWIVRPDMAIGTVFFLGALWLAARPRRRTAAALLCIAAALPAAYEVFRMGYYGELVPNTAIAKQASTFHLSQGLTYLGNFAVPYKVWIPAILLAALFPVLVGRRRLDRTGRACVGAAALAGLAMASYVVLIGGDFMQARMLLPPVFTLLLPVMAVPVPTLDLVALQKGGRAASAALSRNAAAAAGIAAVLVWCCVCGTSLRSQDTGATIVGGIANERAYWVVTTGDKHPDSPVPFKTVAAIVGPPDGPSYTLGWALAHRPESGSASLVMMLPGQPTNSFLPLNRPGVSVAATGWVLGTLGATLPLNGIVVDGKGLAYAFGAHLEPTPGARVGHDVTVEPAWVVADYTNLTAAPGISSAELAAARRVLHCGEVAELQQATQAPMSWSRFVRNVADSFALSRLHVPDDPVAAEHRLCG